MEKKKSSFDFDPRDYKTVKSFYVEEILDEEDLEDGLTPEELLVHLCFSSHSDDRMYHTYGRQVDIEVIEDLIYSKANMFFDLKDGEEIGFINKEHTILVPAVSHFYKGQLIIKVITVIRNVQVVGKTEVERKVKINPNRQSRII